MPVLAEVSSGQQGGVVDRREDQSRVARRDDAQSSRTGLRFRQLVTEVGDRRSEQRVPQAGKPKRRGRAKQESAGLTHDGGSPRGARPSATTLRERARRAASRDRDAAAFP